MNILGVTGQLTQGQKITVTGSGFGTRGKFHADADKMARMFDPFIGGLDKNPYEKWWIFSAASNPVLYKTDSPRTAIPGDGYARRTNAGLGALTVGGRDQKEYYASFYLRQSAGFAFSGGTNQFKLIRFYSVSGAVNLYPSLSLDGWGLAVDNLFPEVYRYQLLMPAIPKKADGWHKFAVYIKKSSAPGVKDGKFKVWYDNKLIFDWLTHFQDPKSEPYPDSPKITGDFDSAGADLAGEWFLGDYFSGATVDTWADLDDVYLDHSQARVEIGDAPKYADCKILEIQPPATWADGLITATVNPGLISSAAYVYVIDAAGNVNADGFKVGGTVTTIPVTSPTPTPTPTPIPLTPEQKKTLQDLETAAESLASQIKALLG